MSPPGRLTIGLAIPASRRPHRGSCPGRLRQGRVIACGDDLLIKLAPGLLQGFCRPTPRCSTPNGGCAAGIATRGGRRWCRLGGKHLTQVEIVISALNTSNWRPKMISVDDPICPRCKGTGREFQSGPKRLPDDPMAPGEERFDLGPDRYRQCGGATRIPRP